MKTGEAVSDMATGHDADVVAHGEPRDGRTGPYPAAAGGAGHNGSLPTPVRATQAAPDPQAGAPGHAPSSSNAMTPAPAACRPRVAFLTRRFGARFGGAEAYAENVVAHLKATHDIHIFCQHWDSSLTDVPYTQLPFRAGLPRWANLVDFARRCAPLVAGYDVVHSHENAWVGDVQGVHVMPVRYARLHERASWGRTLSTWTSPRWLAYLLLERLRFAPRAGRRLVAASDLIAQQIATSYGTVAPVSVITPGVRLPGALNDEARRIARVELGIDGDSNLIHCLLIANDPERKGLDAILRAMTTLDARFRLMVVGGEAGVPQRVRELAVAAGVAGRVRAWPARSHVAPFYAAADICLHPTLRDAFGMVPLEAMAHGVPVVLSGEPWCGFARYVQPEQDALVLPDPTDATHLAACIVRIAQDATLRAQLHTAGLALAARFDWANIAQAYATLYRDVITERG